MTQEEFYEKIGAQADKDGWFTEFSEKGGLPVPDEDYLYNIRVNMDRGDVPLRQKVYDRRTFVYVGAGPSINEHLEEIRAQANDPKNFLVTCSNNTAKYLIEQGIIPHVHWIIDPKASKKADFDVTADGVEYWINLGCHPSVFDNLDAQGRKPKVFLACSNINGTSEDVTVLMEKMKEHKVPRIMSIAGGRTAGLRAICLAEAMGHRKIEYYGFDGCLTDGEAYAFDKKRKEAVIEVEAEDGRKFMSTPMLSDQARAFLEWRIMVPWIEVEIHGDGFIRHMLELQKQKELREPRKPYIPYSSDSRKRAEIIGKLSSQLGTVKDYGPNATEEADLYTAINVVEFASSANNAIDCLDHLSRLAKKAVVLEIDVHRGGVHKPHAWWYREIKKRWIPSEMSESDESLFVVAQNVQAVEEKLYGTDHRQN